MAKEQKYLFESTVLKEVEENVIEKRIENDETVEVKKIVKIKKPIKVAIIKPDRKLYKGAEMFYAKTLSEYLKQGLLPYSLVAKRYANDGGPLSEDEKNKLTTLRVEATKLNEEFFNETIQSNPELGKRKNEILDRINEINKEITTINSAFSDIFDATAEKKSRDETIEWWALHLIYIDEDSKGYKPVFGPGNYDEKIIKLEDYEYEENDFHLEVIKRLSYLVSFWFTARNTVTQIDFSTMEKLYIETVSTYKVKVNKEEIVASVTS